MCAEDGFFQFLLVTRIIAARCDSTHQFSRSSCRGIIPPFCTVIPRLHRTIDGEQPRCSVGGRSCPLNPAAKGSHPDSSLFIYIFIFRIPPSHNRYTRTQGSVQPPPQYPSWKHPNSTSLMVCYSLCRSCSVSKKIVSTSDHRLVSPVSACVASR